MRMKTCVVAAFAAVVLVAAPARADWLFTPFVGGNIGGDTIDSQPNFGLSAAWMGAGRIGFEFDAAWAPDFFDTGDDDPFLLVTDSSVATYMANVVFGAPVGGTTGKGVRPYGSIGIGAIMSRVESDLGLVDIKETSFGWNAGGGVMGFMSDNVGLRGDIRYLGSAQKDFQDSPITENLERFGFWRLTGGIVIRFGGQ